ncbi:MAG: hypothetical protein HY765_03025 [Rhodomicrobium sp.]|nr:hypothetical protein [Rhodomicrobium sp.]
MVKNFDQEPKDRTRPLKAFVSPEERLAIETKASAAGLSVSAYLRAAALGLKIESVHDQKAILALLQLNADQGRLGGLLKLWLVSRAGVGANPGEVRHLLHKIEALQIKLRALIDRL